MLKTAAKKRQKNERKREGRNAGGVVPSEQRRGYAIRKIDNVNWAKERRNKKNRQALRKVPQTMETPIARSTSKKKGALGF